MFVFFLLLVFYTEKLTWDQKQRRNAERVNEIQQLTELTHNAAVPAEQLFPTCWSLQICQKDKNPAVSSITWKSDFLAETRCVFMHFL